MTQPVLNMLSQLPLPLQIMIAALAYGLPAIVAFGRLHRRRVQIAAINCCLGWTIIGWYVALAWAFSPQEPAHWRDGYGLWHDRED